MHTPKISKYSFGLKTRAEEASGAARDISCPMGQLSKVHSRESASANHLGPPWQWH